MMENEKLLKVRIGGVERTYPKGTPYRVIANAIEKSQHKPKDFDVMNRYMMILIVWTSSRRDA